MKIEQMGLDPETQIETFRISWSDGTWWDFKSELDWNTSRQIRIIVGSADSENRAEYLRSAQEAQTARLVGSTLGWSFKSPVAAASIDRLADWRVREALGVLVERHQLNTEVVTDETKKAFNWLSFSKVKSILSGMRR